MHPGLSFPPIPTGPCPTDVLARTDGSLVVTFISGQVVHVGEDGCVVRRLSNVLDRVVALAACGDDVCCKTVYNGIVVMYSEWPTSTRCAWVTAVQRQ